VLDAESVFQRFHEAVEGTLLVYSVSVEGVGIDSVQSMEPGLRARFKRLWRPDEATVAGAVGYAVERLGAVPVGLDYGGLLGAFAGRLGVCLFTGFGGSPTP